MAEKKQRQKNHLKGDALVNKVALIVIEVINTALILGYVSDYMTGTASLTYFITFEIAAIATFFIVPLVYRKNPAKMRYVAFGCFAVVYAIGVLGAHIDVAFVMAFPIVVVFVLYYDLKLITMMAIVFNGVIIADIVYTIFIAKQLHSGTPINSSVLLMEFLGTGIFLVAARVVTSISIQNNEEKLRTIQNVADKVNESIKGVDGEIGKLNESSLSVRNAMDDINAGITSAVDAVQNQLLQTEEIQNRITNVQETANGIADNVGTTLAAVEQGNRDVDALVKQSDKSVEISGKVTADLTDLKSRVDAMKSITQIIESIAFQINIMALNANVEAAHAGEAGKGFAVLASEISGMAAKTKSATDEIAELIKNASLALGELVSSIEEMEGVITAEKRQTIETSEVFVEIKKNTEEVQGHISSFMNYIAGLSDANREIVQSVQTISATTEEVSALSSHAINMEHGNAAAVARIAQQVRELAQS